MFYVSILSYLNELSVILFINVMLAYHTTKFYGCFSVCVTDSILVTVHTFHVLLLAWQKFKYKPQP